MARRLAASASCLVGAVLVLQVVVGVAYAASGQVAVSFTVVPYLSMDVSAQAGRVQLAIRSSTPWEVTVAGADSGVPRHRWSGPHASTPQGLTLPAGRMIRGWGSTATPR
ncbi:MAG TPA: hypothetical protein DEQ28_03385 [Clostridiales bacterium]|nr:hypothetical protein [Clostridiales bacterium]